MTDGKPMNPKPRCRFYSSGTVKLEYAPGSQGVRRIYFTPAKTHTIEYRGEKYAIFVSDPPSGDPRPIDAKAVQLRDNHIEINTEGIKNKPMLRDLALAAIKSVGVDVSVKVKKSEDSEGCKEVKKSEGSKDVNLYLRGAVVQALSHTK